MTPKLKAATFIDKGLELVMDGKYRFLAHVVGIAQALLQKWEAENWGQGEEEEVTEVSTAPTMTTPKTARTQVDHLPPRDHPIYGEHGIMHGVIMDRSAAYGPDGSHRRTVYRRHPSYTPVDAHVFGHNGLEVGRWWPQQLAALFHGAHGSSQGGIAGSAKAGGAFSIVVSGGNPNYGSLDQDLGETIFYSGSRSYANQEPQALCREEPLYFGVGSIAAFAQAYQGAEECTLPERQPRQDEQVGAVRRHTLRRAVPRRRHDGGHQRVRRAVRAV